MTLLYNQTFVSFQVGANESTLHQHPNLLDAQENYPLFSLVLNQSSVISLTLCSDTGHTQSGFLFQACALIQTDNVKFFLVKFQGVMYERGFIAQRDVLWIAIFNSTFSTWRQILIVVNKTGCNKCIKEIQRLKSMLLLCSCSGISLNQVHITRSWGTWSTFSLLFCNITNFWIQKGQTLLPFRALKKVVYFF